MKKLVIKGNCKMGPLVGIWNLPPVQTCRPSDWCIEHCYARRNNFLLPSVQNSLQWRLAQSKKPDFVPCMIEEAGRYQLFRIHAAGDFYDAEYVNLWYKIVEGCPETKFRTTTRRTDLKRQLQRLHSLPNMIVRQSLDGTRPTPNMRLPVAALSGIPAAYGALRCADDCVKCGYKCWYRAVNVQFERF